MGVDVATYDFIVSVCIAVCVTVVFSCACALYVLKRAKLL